MIDKPIRDLVKATAPVLKEHGVSLTRHFYARMFAHNPELIPVFNQGHQNAGAQQQALAMAVAAYAEHIDDPSVLTPVLVRVANKHASLGIRAEHYPIVGRHLLASIREVLGEAATDELVDAWAAAYGQLADVLIGLEAQLYQEAATQTGGWSGWRGFKVQRKVAESDEITSFHLAPADGGTVSTYRPGQYVTVRVLVPELGITQPRQYSLSAAPGGKTLRISVKREDEKNQSPAGLVSNTLHRDIQVGSVIDVAPPMGDFFLHEDRDTPVVLISAGVGVTPMMSMLDHLLQSGSKRTIRFVHACRHGGVQAFGEHVRNLAREYPQVKTSVYFEDPRPEEDRLGVHYDRAGRLNWVDLAQDALLPDADYYLCGPVPFMQEQLKELCSRGVEAHRIHLEAFGTGGVTA
ncbi:MAG: NO-inducible flavohemoprotein [Burkholderiales bacterium]|nr:NO-inducible flavohemoprotein [Burkholderiales bacterium]